MRKNSTNNTKTRAKRIPSHYDLNIALECCVGLNRGLTDTMSITVYCVENIDAHDIDWLEASVIASIDTLLKEINSIFKIGSFRFSFNCTREESQSLHGKRTDEIPPNTDRLVDMITDAVERILREFIRYTAMPNLSDIVTRMDGYVTGKQPKIPDIKDIR